MKSLSWIVIAIAASLNMAGCSEDLDLSEAMPLVDVKLNGGLHSAVSKGDAFTTKYVGRLGVATSDNKWQTSPIDFSDIGVTLSESGLFPAKPISLPPGRYNFHSIATDKTALPTKTSTNSYPMQYTTVDASTTGDLIYASTLKKTIVSDDNQVTLDYNHVYSMVRFEMVKGKISDDNFKKAKPSLAGHHTSGNIDILDYGAITPTATYPIPTDFTKQGQGVDTAGKGYYMIPQDFVSDKPLVFYVNLDGYVARAKISDLKLLGNAKINMRVKVNLLDGLNISIEDWLLQNPDVDNDFTGDFSLDFGFSITGWDSKDDVDNDFGDDKLTKIKIEVRVFDPHGKEIDNLFEEKLVDMVVDKEIDWDNGSTTDNEFKD